MRFFARWRFPALITSAVILFAACGGSADPTPSVGAPQTSTAAPTELPEAKPAFAPKWSRPQEVNPAGMDQLDTYTLSNNERGMHVVVPQLTGHADLNAHMQDWANEQKREFEKDFGPDEAPITKLATPSLSATWSATGISPTMVGFYLESTYSPGASTGVFREIVWYDPATGDLVEWRDLLTETARSRLSRQVITELKRSGITFDAQAVIEVLASGTPAVGFTKDGELFVGFDSYAVAAGASGAPGVSLELPDDGGWLTDAGERALAASIKPAVEDLPAEPNLPEPVETPDNEEVDCEKEKCVALTFDDGPSSKNTPKLLDILAKEDVPATFFVLGTQAKAFPDIVARAAEEGHEIASHTWQHSNLTSLSGKALEKDLTKANKAIKKAFGTTPHLLRPPYGASNGEVAKVAKKKKLALVFWDVDTLDWQHRDPKKTVKHAREAKKGSIVLMHDVHATTVEAVPGVIKSLRKEGFTFVTVSQLMGEMQPGESYFRKSAKN